MSSPCALAASDDMVAVALANPSPEPQHEARSDHESWNVSLLLFDATTGKLRAKGGPWSSDRFFELFPVTRGRFLLLLRHFADRSEEQSETLVLVSSDGEKLKELALAPSLVGSRKDWNKVLVSSSGRTILVQQVLPDSTRFSLLDADSLEPQSGWVAARGTNSPSILALSDKRLLGLTAFKGTQNPAATQGTQVVARSLSSDWTVLPKSLDLQSRDILLLPITSPVAFLSDDVFLGIVISGGSEGRPQALHTDGSSAFATELPKREANTSLNGLVRVTQDGRYFAVGFSHRPWLSHLLLDVWKLDDTFSNDELFLAVWAAGVPTPVANFNLGDEVKITGISLDSGDPSSLVFLRGGTLKALPIPPPR